MIPNEVVALPRDALMEFFGEVALTPWPEDGDCAAKSAKIIEWVDRHDLFGVHVVTPGPHRNGPALPSPTGAQKAWLRENVRKAELRAGGVVDPGKAPRIGESG